MMPPIWVRVWSSLSDVKIFPIMNDINFAHGIAFIPSFVSSYVNHYPDAVRHNVVVPDSQLRATTSKSWRTLVQNLISSSPGKSKPWPPLLHHNLIITITCSIQGPCFVILSPRFCEIYCRRAINGIEPEILMLVAVGFVVVGSVVNALLSGCVSVVSSSVVGLIVVFGSSFLLRQLISISLSCSRNNFSTASRYWFFSDITSLFLMNIFSRVARSEQFSASSSSCRILTQCRYRVNSAKAAGS